eukprot:21509-Heterococcus_DN1.PRE.5
MSAAHDDKSYHNNTNGVPTTAGGRVMHLGVAPGEVANRIITVGSVGRAAVLCSLLEDVTTINSSRGFITHTGTYQGVAVSIICIGMGGSNADFLVREIRACCHCALTEVLSTT